ncbi:MAG: hypothetical protein WD273_01170 [Trueperaceae bacterium]
MAKRRRASRTGTCIKPKPLERHLLGTMFDPSKMYERVLSTGTVVRLRVEELGDGRLMVHEAQRRRGDGPWTRWPEVEGTQWAEDLRLDRCITV